MEPSVEAHFDQHAVALAFEVQVAGASGERFTQEQIHGGHGAVVVTREGVYQRLDLARQRFAGGGSGGGVFHEVVLVEVFRRGGVLYRIAINLN